MTAINDNPQPRCYRYPNPSLPVLYVIGRPRIRSYAWRRYWLGPNGEVYCYADLTGLSALFRTEQDLINAGYQVEKESYLDQD